jgi:hypothetical protein
MTVVVGFVVCFTLPNSPMQAKFLSPEEKQFLVARLQVETGSGKGRVTNDDPLRSRYVKAAFRDWKIWMGVLCWWGNSITVYGYV